MCFKVIFKEPFMLKFCFDKYWTQEMCDKAVDAFLLTLKSFPDRFVTNNMLEKLDDVMFCNGDIDLIKILIRSNF